MSISFFRIKELLKFDAFLLYLFIFERFSISSLESVRPNRLIVWEIELFDFYILSFESREFHTDL